MQNEQRPEGGKKRNDVINHKEIRNDIREEVKGLDIYSAVINI